MPSPNLFPRRCRTTTAREPKNDTGYSLLGVRSPMATGFYAIAKAKEGALKDSFTLDINDFAFIV